MKRIYLPEGASFTATSAQKKELNRAISKLRWSQSTNHLTGFSQAYALNQMIRELGYHTDRVGESGPGGFFNNQCLLAIRNCYKRGPVHRITLYGLFQDFLIVIMAIDEESKEEIEHINRRNQDTLKRNKNQHWKLKKSGRKVAFRRNLATVSQTITLLSTSRDPRPKRRPFKEEGERICSCCDHWYKEWKYQDPEGNQCPLCTRRELRRKVMDYHRGLTLLTYMLRTEPRRRLLALPAYKQRRVVNKAREIGVIGYYFR